MSKNQKGLTIFILVFFFVCFAAVTTAAEESAEYNPGSFPVADVTVGPHGLTFQPKVEYGSLVLTVSKPDGRVESQSFASGITPYFELAGDLIDGSYTYELKVIPVSVKRERLSTVESEGAFIPEGETQTGYFFVKGGRIVTTAASPEGIARPLDVQHIDDVIITGSLCVGFDCVNGESFGFDTIRLKENNLRIHFQDTSNSGSFPTNDWRIIINDSSNGGADYFAVEDSTAGRKVFTLEAGAPANSLYVDDGGRLGLGTSTPVVEAHIKDGDTPTLRLEQDGSSGFTPQTWDLAGNETNFFVRDVTNGSKLAFRIRPGAPTSSIYIDTNGDIGFGTDSPDAALDIALTSGTTEPGIRIFGDTNTFTGLFLERDGDSTAKFVAAGSAVQFGAVTNSPVKIFVNDSTEVFAFNTNGSLSSSTGASLTTAGVWTDNSSRAAKKNIRDLSSEDAFKTLDELNPVRYYYKVDESDEYLGFIAEDVPELVAVKNRKGMAPMDVVAVLTKVLKEQQKTISELKKRIEQLEKEKN